MDAAHGHHTGQDARPLNRLAFSATAHCLTGCAIGEILGLVIGTWLGWGNLPTIVLAVALAFVFGYSLTMLPLLRSGLALATTLPLAFASDTFSITVMEIVDNGVMLLIPGAMHAGLATFLFWGSLAFALAVAFAAAFPVNRYLIARGRGHAVVHEHHQGHGADPPASDESSPIVRLAAFGALLLVIAAAAVGLGAALQGGSGEETARSKTEGGEHDAGGHGTKAQTGGEMERHGEAGATGLAVADSGYQLELSDTTLDAGDTRRLSLRVLDEEGRAVRELDEEGGVRMHLIVVRRDLVDYQHLHPKLAADGSWQTDLTLPRAGVYRVFTDFERGGKKTVLAADLFVAGQFSPARLPAATPHVEVEDYQIAFEGTARAGTEAELRFRVTRRGETVDLEPYLGADGHLVALRAGDLAYLHVHPLADVEAGEIRFAATFPSAGTYRLFLQFNDRGRIHTAAYTLGVRR